MDTAELRIFFDRCYPLLTGKTSPYYWQGELFQKFCAGDFPTEIDLPTGTGKTSLMDIWFLALTRQALEGKLTIPRRLVWVVNRRVVVDQATDRAMDIAENCKKLPSDCTKALSSLSVTGCEAPAISTLRGEKADNREWTKDPSRPAIVIGTVDMIGSRLLFSGYRDGHYYRPQHAGLLGVDTLVINDEAHLTPAFIHLLGGISGREPARHIEGKKFFYLSLSATPSHGRPQDRFPRSLENDMAANATFRTRVTGYKRLSLHPVVDNKKLESTILELAMQLGAPRTIVYIEEPEKALEMFKKIDKIHRGRVELLTGTMRGYERDRLLTTPVFKAMISEDPPADPVWLVATSAGEVGIDITSERQISTLVTADHLIQRFGRLNRFGTGHGEAHVVYVSKDNETVLQKTLDYLQNLEELDGGRDIRCLALREKPPPADAQTEAPVLAELHDWLLELWCQTSDPVKGYRPVESWLHGQKEGEGPETELAWREEIPDLTSEHVSDEQRRRALRYHGVLAREKLREPTKRLTKKLELLADIQPGATRVIVQRKDHSIEVCSLREAVDGEPLDYSLVLLPPRMGALIHGMFSPALPSGAEYANDVADEVSADGGRRRERWRGVRSDQGGFNFTRVTGDLAEQEVVEDLTSSLKSLADRRGMRLMLQVRIPISEEDETPDRVLIFLRERAKRKSTEPVLLPAHSEDVSYYAGALAGRLVPNLAQLYREAGHLHDAGKASDLWQRVMGNSNPSIKVAKPIRLTKGGGGLGGYRHELGSLVDARRPGSITASEGTRDLLLHLIASHHGHARPHFPKGAHDTRAFKESDDAMVESVERFGHLINEWGLWGLAYLEAIFKAADGIASREEEESSAAEAQPDDEHD